MKVLVILAALSLGACAGEEGSMHDILGANIGTPKQTEIDPAESRLLLPQTFLPVEKVISGSLPDRTFEELKLKGGYLELEQTAGAAYRDDISDSKFRSMFKSLEEREGSGDKIVLEPKRKHPITYAEFKIGSAACLVFRRPVGVAVPNVRGMSSAHDGIVTGFYCDAADQADFTVRTLGYIREIRLRRPGEGKANPVLGTPPDEPPLKPRQQVQAYLDQNRHDIRQALSAYNRKHRALVGNNTAMDVRQITSIEIRKLDGDRVFVETSFTVGKPGSSYWTAGAGTLLFELRWTEDELAFIGHSKL